jgi:hypothetical protein
VKGRLALLGVLFGGLLIALLVLQPSKEEQLPPLTVYSAAPTGGRAFWLWLGEIGYSVSTVEGGAYRVPSERRTVLILSPILPFSDSEGDELERWVRGGGTLVIAADGLFAGSLLERFGLGLRALPRAVESAQPIQGEMLDASIGEVTVRASDELVLGTSNGRPFLVDGERVFGAVIPRERGRVVALSAPAALSNAALWRQDNARMALSLVGPPGRGRVMFDERHHGYGLAEGRPLHSLLLDQAWGRAALYAGLAILLFLLLSGRRFGRPRQLEAARGRSLSEYVSSMAALYRSGRKRSFLAEHFQHRLHRDFAQDLGLPGDASLEQIKARARAMGHDPSVVLRILGDLGRRATSSEHALLGLVRDGECARAALVERGAWSEGRGARSGEGGAWSVERGA